jgi:hypothetical protein
VAGVKEQLKAEDAKRSVAEKSASSWAAGKSSRSRKAKETRIHSLQKNRLKERMTIL